MMAACQSPQSENSGVAAAATQQEEELQAAAYGQAITDKAAKPVAEVPRLLQGKDSVQLTLSGTALSSCTKKGCWMTVDLGEGESMRVTFKDYAFFVPKDLSGERVLMQGVLKQKISSVDDQRHYAEDAGKSAAEIAAIQQPDTAYTFEAAGVLIWPKQQ